MQVIKEPTVICGKQELREKKITECFKKHFHISVLGDLQDLLFYSRLTISFLKGTRTLKTAWNWLFPDNKNNKKLLQEGVGESKKKTP